MNTFDSRISDEDLRQALGQIDPQTDEATDQEAIDRAWARIVIGAEQPEQPGRPRRRWLELAVAACLGAALVGGAVTVAGQYVSPGSGSATVSSSESAALPMPDGPASEAAPSDSGSSTQTPSTTLARDASAVVATSDVQAARDAFVAKVRELNGTVTSETTSTGSDDNMQTVTDMARYPYPPTPSGPGVSLAVEVPTAAYDQAVAAATELGEVVQFTQSSQEVGAEYAQGKARIASLKASLATLQGLMDKATSISDVIALEDAIAQRQSDLDALSAQQAYLESQISQARISLRLITPADAASMYGTPQWWQQVGQTLADVWAWLGRALLWTSPLWIIGGLWWIRRRRRA